MPALRIKLPNAQETTHILHGTRVTVGRAPDNTIQIPHASISSHHAEFVAVDGRYQLHDLQSTNRSYVEGQPVTEVRLGDTCKILFGSVECEFQATPPPTSKRLELPPSPVPAEPRVNVSHLETENRALREHLSALQRRFDILGSARLVAGRTDLTPFATAGDAMKSLSQERDELRQENASLRLQGQRLREELAVTARERDAARQAAEEMQTEGAALRAELGKTQTRVQQFETLAAAAAPQPAAPAPADPPPLRPPPVKPVQLPSPPPSFARAVSAPVVVAPTPSIPAAPAPTPAPPTRPLPKLVHDFRESLAHWSANPTDVTLLGPVDRELAEIIRAATPLAAHPFLRIAKSLQDYTREVGRSAHAPAASPLRTLRHAGELLTRLVEAPLLAGGGKLPVPQILVIDDDADLLGTLTTALQGAGLEVSGCSSGEEALIAIEALRFDTIIADLKLPKMDGAAFCTQARERPAYRRTPILFLTVADTLDKRAATSLSGGNEFIAKPFSVSELVLKVECWALKQQLQMV